MSDAVELAAVPEVFERWLAGGPWAERSRREYARNVRSNCACLAVTPDRDGWQGDALTDPVARDHAPATSAATSRSSGSAAASTVNLALASRDALYRCLGLGRPNVHRDKRALAAPRAGRSGGSGRCCARHRPRRSARGRLVMLMLFTALRISETWIWGG